jgi:CHAT domain-containing protein/tetratricopeptide (TPR) repeat protein
MEGGTMTRRRRRNSVILGIAMVCRDPATFRGPWWNLAACVLLVLGLAVIPARLLALDDVAKAKIPGLTMRADQFKKQGRYEQATELYEQVVKLAAKGPERDDPFRASFLNELATLYLLQEKYEEAIPPLKQSLMIVEKRYGAKHPKVASIVGNLATANAGLGRYVEAEQLNKRALAIVEAALGPDHPSVANGLVSLAIIYKRQNRLSEAEQLYRRSLTIRVKWFGPDHPELVIILNNLAVLLKAQGRYAEALPLAQRSLTIANAKFGRDHPYLANTLDILASIYEHAGQCEDALQLLQRCLAIRQAALGPDHPDVGYALGNLGGVYRKIGRFEEAESVELRGLKILEARLGPDSHFVAMMLSNLSLAQVCVGHQNDAFDSADRSRRTMLRYCVRVLSILSEQEQLNFLKSEDVGPLHGALTLVLRRSDDPSTATRSAGWVINSKGLVQQMMAERALLARADKSVAGQRTFVQLRDVRTRMAALMLVPPRNGKEVDRRRELDRLESKEQELTRELGRVTNRSIQTATWVDPESVRKVLPAEAVLVEFARFRVCNFQARGLEPLWLPPRYLAWVIPREGRGEVRVIDLGPAEPIEAAVVSARAALRIDPKVRRARSEPRAEPPSMSRRGLIRPRPTAWDESSSERQTRKPLEALATLILTPLLADIGPARRWVISPDASLWLVPWGALPVGEGKYAIEDHEIGYVVSGRDLVQDASAPPGTVAFVLADPDFSLDPDQAREAARTLKLPFSSSSSSLLALRGSSSSLNLEAVARLPGTAAEARAIAPKLRAFARVEPSVYTDRWALESVFKSFRQPRVVVFSTHGFFLEERDGKPEERDGLGREVYMPSRGPALENPLLRCGLLLAGCSHQSESAVTDGNDGVLTGMEIVGTDLRGTELVVLSACETGLGQIRNGEGVAGLRQAFQLAGAQTVVATLWQVPDQESAELMSGFFDNLAAGRSKVAALREAQLSQIQSSRTQRGAAHPFFWAAYTVTGPN